MIELSWRYCWFANGNRPYYAHMQDITHIIVTVEAAEKGIRNIIFKRRGREWLPIADL